MKRGLLIFVLLLFPSIVNAICSDQNYTVIYINGILTSEDQANTDKKNLDDQFNKLARRTDVTFITGYNPSHIEGLGDFFKSLQQTYRSEGKGYIDDYDLRTILLKAHADVQTRKILLVGFSQGTFYTNAAYEYLVAHGVPKESIGVYNIATPASFVGGGGTYLTSANDKVIERVRELAAAVNAQGPLSANILLPISSEEALERYGGHSFGNIYLPRATGRVISEIEKILSKLSADTSSEICFEAPKKDWAYRMEGTMFGIVDPAAHLARELGKNTGTALAKVTEKAEIAVDGFFHGLVAWLPPANTDSAKKGFNVVRALYGSSLSEEDVEDLLKDQGGAAILAVQDEKPEKPSQTVLPPTKEKKPAPKPPTPPKPKVALPIVPSKLNGTGGPTERIEILPTEETRGIRLGGGDDAFAEKEETHEQPAEKSDPFSVTAPSDGETFATTTITVSGIAPSGTPIELEYGIGTTTVLADAADSWSVTLTLPEGTYSIEASAYEAVSAATTTITRLVTIDLPTLDVPALSVLECNHSLAMGFCLVPETTVNLSWSTSSAAVSYAVVVNGIVGAPSNAISTTVVLTDRATSTLEIVAYDASGARATSTVSEIGVYANPIVINEVGWGGTNASANDQWIELMNVSPYMIDLSSLTISSTDASVYIPLSGSITPGILGDFYSGYLTIVPNSSVTPSPIHTLPTPFSLDAAGEELTLSYGDGLATTTLDTTPAVSECGGWCAGALAAETRYSNGIPTLEPVSMERLPITPVSAYVRTHMFPETLPAAVRSGMNASGWASHDTYTYGSLTALDSVGNPIRGSIGFGNSAHLSSYGWFCDPDDGSISNGYTYMPQTSNCHYLAAYVADGSMRSGAVFKGVPGNATLLQTHALSGGLSSSEPYSDTSETTLFDPSNLPSAGDPMFIVFYNGSAIGQTPIEDYFENYLTTGASLPHPDTRILEFTWGP